jgi:hypothetical protein
MIPNPENPFEELQNDVAAQIMSTPPFTTIKLPTGTDWQCLTEDEGDIQMEFDTMIAQVGLAIVVQACTAKNIQPDIPGPLLGDVSFDVWVSEAPTFNRSELGTKLRLSKAMTIVMAALHGFQPGSISSPIWFAGFDKARERTYNSEGDKVGTLITSRILHFKAPMIAASISPT